MIWVPFLASKMGNAREGLRRTVYVHLLFLVVWALIGPRLYLAIPDE